jgi:uncharacterized membrane protein
MAGAPASTAHLSTGRAVDRLINFSDAVVAVAITLMVLPLASVDGPQQGETMLTVLHAHWPQLVTFLFTFYVVAIMWATHNRILNVIRGYDATIFWLNASWLAAIVLLPWLTAMRDSSGAAASGADLAYWWLLALISALGGLIGGHIRRHPELAGTDASQVRRDFATRMRGPAFTALFLLIGIASLFSGFLSDWMPLLIIPLSIWLRPARQDAVVQDEEWPPASPSVEESPTAKES